MRIPSAALVAAFLVCGCADPRGPSGGPADKTPPGLVMSMPDNEAVNVNPTEIRLTFSEYVDHASFSQALTITPAVEGRLRIRWRGRRVSLRLPEALRDSTTYLVMLNTRLRDARGVSLLRPITLAFATGPVIDQGRLRGRLVEPARGDPVSGYDVFAYAATDMDQGWPESPAYRTQTDEDGVFELRYVREAGYFVIALQDQNRNQSPDANENFAAPPQKITFAAADTTTAPGMWVVSQLDTLPPSIDRVRALSDQRVAVRFSEAVMMTVRTPEAWMLVDSTMGTQVAVQEVYALEHEPRVVYLLTDRLDTQTYGLIPDAQLSDSSGNAVKMDTIYFEGRSRADTMQVRFLRFLPDGSTDLRPRDIFGVIFNQAVPGSLLDTLVSASDTSGHELPLTLTSHDGTVYQPSLLLLPGEAATVRVTLPDSSTHERLFRRLSEHELGILSGVASPAGDSIVVALRRAEQMRILAKVRLDSTGVFAFEDLPKDNYRIQMFADRNGNGQWDGGQLLPFVPPEPITWLSEVIAVRPRWDTALGDTLQLFTNPLSVPDSTARQ